MSLPDPPARTLRLRIDRAALAANWRALDRLSGSAETGAAVKADGYGLGIANVLPPLLEAGARTFFVAHWSEVADLLAHVPGESVAVLHGVGTAEEALYARETGAVPVLNSIGQARTWQESGGGRCHLMVDTGINRLGLEPWRLGEPVLEKLEIDILMSHLASADEDSDQNARQLADFRQFAAAVSAKRLSLANSAGIALGPDYHFGLTRPGLALYGGTPRPQLGESISQVAFPEAAIIQIRDLEPGDSVGYNATWTADRAMKIATVSIGYADGLLRSWGQGGALQHAGRALPILGRVSMDMIMVDCLQSDLREGDFLSIPYDLAGAARITGLSQYELLTVLGSRFNVI